MKWKQKLTEITAPKTPVEILIMDTYRRRGATWPIWFAAWFMRRMIDSEHYRWVLRQIALEPETPVVERQGDCYQPPPRQQRARPQRDSIPRASRCPATQRFKTKCGTRLCGQTRMRSAATQRVA